MAALAYPLKAEVEGVRACVQARNPLITEEIKWNAPSFGYRGEYLVTLNLADKKNLRLIFHNSLTPQVASEILEGNFPDGRRIVNIRSSAEFDAKKGELEIVIDMLIKLVDSAV